ncbi:MAG: hypothetical protein H6742_19610 [Alphaproteobacteria bacterium]|nr:hypothetical protein [Alphaproteobacteria bacterium]
MWDLATGPILGGVLGLLAGRLPSSLQRVGVSVAFGVGAWLAIQPPWPPLSAAQRVVLLAPLALVAGLGGPVAGGVGAGVGIAVAAAALLLRLFDRDPVTTGVIVLVAAVLGGGASATALPARSGRLLVGGVGLLAAAAIAGTGSLSLGGAALVAALAVGGTASGSAPTTGPARAGVALLAVLLSLGVALSELPPVLAVGLGAGLLGAQILLGRRLRAVR